MRALKCAEGEAFYITLSLVKKIILFLAIAVIFTASCSRQVQAPSRYFGYYTDSNAVQGDFVLTKFTNLNSNADSTDAFNGYVFSFGDNGKITAVKNNQTTQGSYKESYSSDDNLELAFYFSNKPLSYINGNWWVKLISDASIELGDAATGDVLEFTAH